MIDIWGRRGAFRQQQDLQNEGLRLRNETLRQNLTPDQGNAAAPRFIGGQFVAGGEDPSEAIQNFNDRTATSNATALMRQQMGSTEVSSMRGMADSAMGGGATELTLPGTSSGFRTSTQQERGALPPLSSAGNTREPRITRSETPESYTRSLLDDTYEDLLRPGLRNGGMVMKPKMVKQPGYKNGGKVKIPGQDCAPGYEMGGQIGPEVTKWAGEKKKKKGMRGYAKSGKIGKVSEDDGMDTVDVRTREGEYLLNPETVEFLGGGDYQQGVRMLDETVMQATGEAPGPVPVNEEGEAMRGFRKGGKMGYAAGGTMLVNSAGETVQIINGRPVINTPSMPAVIPQQAAAGPGPATINSTPVSSTVENLSRGERWARAGERAGSTLRNNPAFRTAAGAKNFVAPSGGWKTPGAVVPAVTGAMTAASNLTGARDAFFNDPNVPWDEKAKLAAGEVSSFALPTAGAVIGAAGGSVVGTPVAGGVAGGVGGLALGAMADRGLRTLVGAPAEGTEAFNEYAANWSPEEVAEAEAAGQTPEQYFRPFSGGAVDLRGIPEQAASTAVDPGQMAVVQRTGGPDGEVIVREDINGVPTFSNLRTAPQAGDAATLQAQADQRVMEDLATGQRNNAVVEQMRQNAPRYGNDAVAARETEAVARRERALAAAENKPNMTLDELQGEFESLGMFTDPETSKFSPQMFSGFVQTVINPMVEQGLIDPSQLTGAQILQLAAAGQDAEGITRTVNSALRRNGRLPLGGIVTPDMVGPVEDASFFTDLGYFNDRSDLGFLEALAGDKRVIQTPEGPIALPADQVGLRTQRQVGIYDRE
jgi:hypothetical protein